jgi:hypothetical protein
MDWLNALSDDQIAMIGCVFALATSFAMMSLTWTVRQTLQPRETAATAYIKRARTQPTPAAQERRAA